MMLPGSFIPFELVLLTLVGYVLVSVAAIIIVRYLFIKSGRTSHLKYMYSLIIVLLVCYLIWMVASSNFVVK